jgi:hypothetical protein
MDSSRKDREGENVLKKAVERVLMSKEEVYESVSRNLHASKLISVSKRKC